MTLQPSLMTCMGHYELPNTIGQGSFGKLRLHQHILTHTEVAVKVTCRLGSSNTHALFLQEVKSMKALHHPNIVQLLAVIDTPGSFHLVMEYLSGGNLWKYLQTHGRVAEEAQHILRQLVLAVHHYHEQVLR